MWVRLCAIGPCFAGPMTWPGRRLILINLISLYGALSGAAGNWPSHLFVALSGKHIAPIDHDIALA